MSNSRRAVRNDVAKLAGVSPATVSNYINNKGNVSEELGNRVMWAIKELNYTPDLVARSMKTRSSKHIGLVIQEITNPHFSEMTKGAQYQASLFGYVLSISLFTEKINDIIEDYIARRADGIIFNADLSVLTPDLKKRLEDTDIEYIICGELPNPNKNLIAIDYYGGAVKAYKYLYELGHRKIAFASGLNDMKDESGTYIHGRLEAYKWCCNNIGDGFKDEYLTVGSPPYATDYMDGYNSCMELLNRKIDFTAIIAGNDYMAVGILRALAEKGLKVPRDISVVSFDNTLYAEMSYPSLTSLGASSYKIGQKAVQHLINIKEGREDSEKGFRDILEMELVERESTAPPKNN